MKSIVVFLPDARGAAAPGGGEPGSARIAEAVAIGGLSLKPIMCQVAEVGPGRPPQRLRMPVITWHT